MNLRPLAAAATLLALISCTGGTDGIFASIEKERKIVSLGGLNTTATVTHMAELTSVGKYFATGGRALFSRSTAAGTTAWDKSTVGGSSEVLAVGVTGSTAVWAVAGGQLWKSTDGSSWVSVALSTASDTPNDLIPIRTADGYSSTELLVVSTDTAGSKNRVYRIAANGTTFTAAALVGTSGGSVSAIPSLSSPVHSAVYDGTNYYLANENYLWQLTNGMASPVVVTVSGAPSVGYRGLLYVTGGGFYLTTRSNNTTGGGIYWATSFGSPMSFSSLVTGAQKNSSALSFGTLLANTDNSSLWVATESSGSSYEGQGYVEVGLPGSYSSTPSTNTNNFNSSDLRTSAVKAFFRSSSGSYFLGTVAHGLWTWNWAGTAASSTWSQQ